MVFPSPFLLPAVPFQQNIEFLSVGMAIYIQGQVQHSPNGFAFTVNLLDTSGNIVFHFNPRMNEKEVVCNTRDSRGWGKEERCPIPFVAGANFTMIIDVMNNCYKVSVNNKDLLKYSHRIHFESVRALEIKGDVLLQRVS